MMLTLLKNSSYYTGVNSEFITSIIETLGRKLQESIIKSIETALVAIKKDVQEALRDEMEDSKLRTELQILCESGKIENYKTR